MLVRRNTYFITLQPILPSNAHIRTQLFRSRIFNSIAIFLFWALKSKYHFYGISILNSRYNYRFEDRLLCNRIVKQEILGLMTGLCQSYVTLNTTTSVEFFLNSQLLHGTISIIADSRLYLQAIGLWNKKQRGLWLAHVTPPHHRKEGWIFNIDQKFDFSVNIICLETPHY